MGNQEPYHKNFHAQPIEKSDNDTVSEDLTTLPKPEIDLANNKPHANVQALDRIDQKLQQLFQENP